MAIDTKKISPLLTAIMKNFGQAEAEIEGILASIKYYLENKYKCPIEEIVKGYADYDRAEDTEKHCVPRCGLEIKTKSGDIQVIHFYKHTKVLQAMLIDLGKLMKKLPGKAGEALEKIPEILPRAKSLMKTGRDDLAAMSKSERDRNINGFMTVYTSLESIIQDLKQILGIPVK